MRDKRTGKGKRRNGRLNWMRFEVLSDKRRSNIVLKVS